MSLLTGFGPLYVKEAKELLREKRLFVILVVFGLLLGIPFSVFFVESLSYGFTPGFTEIFIPLQYMLPMALLILGLTFAADTVSKEKDSGMLGLVLASPVTTEGFLAAKLAGAFTAYAVFAAFVTAFVLMLAPAFGFVVVEVALWLFAVPLLALWIFLVGLGMLVSVSTSNSKTAVGLGIAVFLPLFLLMQEEPGLGFLIREFSPFVYQVLEYNPIGAAISTSGQMIYGSPFPWAPVVVSAVLGVGLVVVSWLLFRRQEVAG